MYMKSGGSGREKKANGTGATAAAALLGREAMKEQKRMKLQMCNEQCSTVGGCHGERMKLDEEKGTWRKFFIFVFLSPLVSHSRDIEPDCCPSPNSGPELTLTG